MSQNELRKSTREEQLETAYETARQRFADLKSKVKGSAGACSRCEWYSDFYCHHPVVALYTHDVVTGAVEVSGPPAAHTRRPKQLCGPEGLLYEHVTVGTKLHNWYASVNPPRRFLYVLTLLLVFLWPCALANGHALLGVPAILGTIVAAIGWFASFMQRWFPV